MAEYIRNAWYMVAFESEIPDEGMFKRTILDKPMIFFRKQDRSAYVGMIDRCPHRFAPLSMGTRIADTIQCGYHGLVFDSEGKCVGNPWDGVTPPACTVDSFVVEAKHRVLWMWAGHSDDADTSKIPDFSASCDQDDFDQYVVSMDCHWELAVDNILDLSHIEFAHAPSGFGGPGTMSLGNMTTSEEGDMVWAKWWIPGAPATPPWTEMGAPEDAALDKWTDVRWNAPGSAEITMGACISGTDRYTAAVGSICFAQIVTPETQTTCHYFTSEPAVNEANDKVNKEAMIEDQAFVAAVQKEMGNVDFWDLKPAIIKTDSAAIRARRRVMKMLREEASAKQNGVKLKARRLEQAPAE